MTPTLQSGYQKIPHIKPHPKKNSHNEASKKNNPTTINKR